MPRVTSLAGIPMSITLTRPAYSLRRGIATDPGVRRREEDLAANTAALQMARDHETVAAVATFAADHDDTTRARRTLRGREPGEHGLGGAASGILHQRRAGDPQVA